MSPRDRDIASLKGALLLVDDRLASDPCAAWTEVQQFLQKLLAQAVARTMPRNIEEAAAELGLSPETVRRRIHQRAPWMKRGGRFDPFTAEILELLR